MKKVKLSKVMLQGSLYKSNLKMEEVMTKKTMNNGGTYALQCSRCKKIRLPQKETSRGNFEQLAILEDLIKDWVSGKINTLPEMSIFARTFVEEAIHMEIQNFVTDILFDEAPNCKCGPYSIVKCNAQKKWLKWER